MAEDRRREKVDILIREEVASIINKELLFPKGVLVTVTRIVSSHDLYYADAFISVFPKKEAEVLALLNKKVSFIQGTLNKRLKMRPVPRLQFKIDEEEKKRERIEKLIAKSDNLRTQRAEQSSYDEEDSKEIAS